MYIVLIILLKQFIYLHQVHTRYAYLHTSTSVYGAYARACRVYLYYVSRIILSATCVYAGKACILQEYII